MAVLDQFRVKVDSNDVYNKNQIYYKLKENKVLNKNDAMKNLKNVTKTFNKINIPNYDFTNYFIFYDRQISISRG